MSEFELRQIIGLSLETEVHNNSRGKNAEWLIFLFTIEHWGQLL
jgi:hypothetical protein